MCGRFSLSGDVDFYAEYFGVDHVLPSRSIDPGTLLRPTRSTSLPNERKHATSERCDGV